MNFLQHTMKAIVTEYNMATNVLPNYADKVYGGSWAVEDETVLNFLATDKPTVNHKDFVNDYYEWFRQPHYINGIEKFKSLTFCNGSTEAFDKFYHKHMHRNLRFLPGEYYYHQIMARRYFKNWSFINDVFILSENDVVVMSVPFSDTGGLPKNYTRIMEACEALNIPVLLDLAYINIAKQFDFNVDYECIDTITTSMSKVFPVPQWRIGLRMQKQDLDDTLDAYHHNGYVNNASVNVGSSLIRQYTPDYSYNKYRSQQLNLCKQLDLTPSPCFTFGIDFRNKHPEYNRGGPSNRFCFSKHFQ